MYSAARAAPEALWRGARRARRAARVRAPRVGAHPRAARVPAAREIGVPAKGMYSARARQRRSGAARRARRAARVRAPRVGAHPRAARVPAVSARDNAR